MRAQSAVQTSATQSWCTDTILYSLWCLFHSHIHSGGTQRLNTPNTLLLRESLTTGDQVLFLFKLKREDRLINWGVPGGVTRIGQAGRQTDKQADYILLPLKPDVSH